MSEIDRKNISIKNENVTGRRKSSSSFIVTANVISSLQNRQVNIFNLNWPRWAQLSVVIHKLLSKQ